MSVVLVTGIEPFDGESLNPSWEVARRLDGQQPVDEPVFPEGPAGYFTTLPIKAMVQALRREGIPASVSQTAGTYNCNAIFYGLCHYIASRQAPMRGGFVHLPYLPEMAAAHPGVPSMALATQRDAVKTLIRTALMTASDIRVGAGAVLETRGMNKKTQQRYPDGLWLNGAWTGWILALAAYLMNRTLLCAAAASAALGLLVLYFVKTRVENRKMFGKKMPAQAPLPPEPAPAGASQRVEK